MQLQHDGFQLECNTPVLPVLVWGTGMDGHIFREQATAKDLTHDGALLTGVVHPVATGDLVGVQYQEQKAHARVIKTGQAENTTHWLLWVELLEKSRCPWAHVRQAPRPAASLTSATPAERRRFSRYPLSVSVHVHRSVDYTPTFFKTKDISESGCYIETIFPLAKQTHLNMSLELGSNLISCNGVVRTCDVNVGMGIEFVGLGEDAQGQLSRYIREHIAFEAQSSTIQ